jgi:methylated-DNA-[protein]-cysteine S-methyltransferase
MNTIHYRRVDSPVGVLTIAATDAGLHAIEFPSNRHPQKREGWREGDHPLLDQAQAQLEEYFAGERQAFELPLAPQGTPFQREVWFALAAIPYGETASYAQLAARVERPAAMRAVGAANGRNPLPIVLPCHRVIGADGSHTGFGGGLPTKRFLLELEGALPQATTPEDLFPMP